MGGSGPMYGVSHQTPSADDQGTTRFIREGNPLFGEASSLASGGDGVAPFSTAEDGSGQRGPSPGLFEGPRVGQRGRPPRSIDESPFTTLFHYDGYPEGICLGFIQGRQKVCVSNMCTYKHEPKVHSGMTAGYYIRASGVKKATNIYKTPFPLRWIPGGYLLGLYSGSSEGLRIKHVYLQV